MSRSLNTVKRLFNSGGANNMTGTAVIVSPIIDQLGVDKATWEIVTTGTPTGTWQLEGSAQYDPVTNPTPTFVPLANNFLNPALVNPAGAGASSIASGAGAAPFRFVRLRYTNTSGTGTLDAWYQGMGIT